MALENIFEGEKQIAAAAMMTFFNALKLFNASYAALINFGTTIVMLIRGSSKNK